MSKASFGINNNGRIEIDHYTMGKIKLSLQRDEKEQPIIIFMDAKAAITIARELCSYSQPTLHGVIKIGDLEDAIILLDNTLKLIKKKE